MASWTTRATSAIHLFAFRTAWAATSIHLFVFRSTRATSAIHLFAFRSTRATSAIHLFAFRSTWAATAIHLLAFRSAGAATAIHLLAFRSTRAATTLLTHTWLIHIHATPGQLETRLSDEFHGFSIDTVELVANDYQHFAITVTHARGCSVAWSSVHAVFWLPCIVRQQQRFDLFHTIWVEFQQASVLD